MAFIPQPSPSPAPLRPEAAILALGDAFYDPVRPADFPQAIIRFRNDRWADAVGLSSLSDEDWVRRFARFEAIGESLPQPLALRYHGHQFRVYNPEIGDGRGFLYAQLRDGRARLLDLGTKGSGRTPWSRFGDGRLTLKGGVREVLATEMLEALGVNTSKTFSLIETGEALDRNDEPSPTRSAVLVRLSHGHIRIGSFQRLATLRDADGLRALTAYALDTFYDGDGSAPDAPVRLLRHVVAATARLAASYMAAGFVHGVLNSDNINITGESFDYGPWRFAPSWDPGFTAAYFDQAGLYAFARQPEAIHWDVVQLAISLRSIAEEEPLLEALAGFGPAYGPALVDRMLWRLGVTPRGMAADQPLIEVIERAMIASGAAIDRFFHDWQGGAWRGGGPVPDGFGPVAQALADYAPARPLDHPHWARPDPCGMAIEEVEVIWSAIDTDDDWGPFHAKIAAIRDMGAALRA